MDPDQTFNHFRDLGMPRSISLDDFLRMYQLNGGNFGLVIEGVKERLLGRQDTDVARRKIQQLRDDFNRAPKRLHSKIRMPSAGLKDAQTSISLEDPKKTAKTKQESAERVLVATKMEWQREVERYNSLDKSVRELQAQLKRKQEKLLVLSVLEKREVIRINRLGTFSNGEDLRGIGNMLNVIRTDTSLSMSALKTLVHSSDKVIGAKNYATSLPRSRQMVDILTNLTAYQSRIQKALSLPPPDLAALELQLRNLVQKCHEKFMPEQSLDEVINHAMGIAEARAERKYKFRPISEIPNENHDKLENQRTINQAKHLELEAALREAIRLKLQSENHIDTISTFREQASTSLSEMLHEEQNRILGYVDTAKDHVLKRESDNESEAFIFEAIRLLDSSRVNIWDDLEGDLIHLQASQELLRLDLNPCSDYNIFTQRIDETLKSVNKSGHKLELLLERKGRKADYALQLVEEIKDIGSVHRKIK